MNITIPVIIAIVVIVAMLTLAFNLFKVYSINKWRKGLRNGSKAKYEYRNDIRSVTIQSKFGMYAKVRDDNDELLTVRITNLFKI